MVIFMGEIARTKLSKSYLTTVPGAVRRFLKLDWGDEISWQIKDGDVVVVKAESEGEVST